MKRYLFTLVFLIIAMLTVAQEKMMFIVTGPERSYNQIRIVNETSIETLRCRLLLLDKEYHMKSVYAIVSVGLGDDVDSKGESVKRGTKIGIEFPKQMTKKLDFSIEYRDRPFFDAVVIHIFEKDGDFNSQFSSEF